MSVVESAKDAFRSENNSPWRVGLSMCATWSLGVSMAAGLTLLGIWGFAPFVVWMTFNVLSVPLFVVVYLKFPQIQKFIDFRIMQLVMVFVLFAYITINLNAMVEVVGPGIELLTYQFLSETGAVTLAMGVSAALFVFIYFTGLNGSISTDIFQYAFQIIGAMLIAVTGIIWGTPGVDVPATADTSVWLIAATVGLLSGPYVDPAQWQRIEKAPQLETGLWAGFWFGIYIIFVLLAALNFGPESLIHGILLVIVVYSVSTSTMDSTAAAFQRILQNRQLALVVGLIGVAIYPWFGGPVGTSWAVFSEYRAMISGTIVAIAVLLTVIPGLDVEMFKTKLDDDTADIKTGD